MEIMILVVASAAVALGAAAVGMWLTAPASSKEDPADLLSGSCIDEPFRAPDGVVVGTLARLCFDVDAVRPRVELTGVTSDSLFTGWLTQPTPAGVMHGNVCGSSDAAAATTLLQPARFDASRADQTGRVQLSASLPVMRFTGDSRIRVLVVDHGWRGSSQVVPREEQLSTWDGTWVHGLSSTANTNRTPGRLVGCATFWPRGGVETLEN